MRKATLTREEAIDAAGIKNVQAVETLNCEHDITDTCDGDMVLFSASINYDDADGRPCVLTVYYEAARDDLAAHADDWGNVDFTVIGYEIV